MVERSVKIYACKNATNISNRLNAAQPTTVAPAIGILFAAKPITNNAPSTVWPAIMFANKRIDSAKGFTNAPINSNTYMKGIKGHGTCGIKFLI